MSLRDALRKAAGLVIEFPPDEEASASQNAASTSSTSTDKMWDDLEQSMKPAAQNVEPSLDTSAVGAPPAPPTRTVEQIVRDAAGPNLDQISVTGEDLPDVFGPDGTPHFAPIYTRAGLPPVSYSAEQMLEMITSLPAELALATRRQTVNAMLKGMGAALGASPETIVADASRKLAALAAYDDCTTRRGDEHVRICRQEIQSFEAQITDRRQSIEAEQARQAKITQACTDQAGQLHQVLEFFSTEAQKQSQP
jgi:hypothetical protein